MKNLTDYEFEFILQELEKKGLTELNVRLELADHIGCMIESDESETKSFEEKYSEIMDVLSNVKFSNIQSQIILSENLKFQAMKKMVYILGIISSITVLAGAILKGLHLPGAAILLIFGVFVAIAGFLPLFFYTSYKEQPDKRSVIPPILAFLATALLVTGALFKTLHYPASREILLIGSIILLGGFLPVYLVSVFRKSQETRNWSAYILLVILFGAVVLMINTTRISSFIISQYERTSIDAKQTRGFFVIQNDSTITKIKNIHLPESTDLIVNQIRLKSKETQQFIDEIIKKILLTSGNTSEQDLKNADSDRACFQVLQKKKVNIQLTQRVEEYKSLLIQNTFNDKSKKLINVYLINDERYENLPLIVVLMKLNELNRNLVLAEYEYLSNLLDGNK
ncbi:MAG TPA: hypothetical protein DIW31_06570 [Bacteroidales bacterium]|nr:hypothetical protein [Bacteroidales bacterium]